MVLFFEVCKRVCNLLLLLIYFMLGIDDYIYDFGFCGLLEGLLFDFLSVRFELENFNVCILYDKLED